MRPLRTHRTSPTMANPPASWTHSMASQASRRQSSNPSGAVSNFMTPRTGANEASPVSVPLGVARSLSDRATKPSALPVPGGRQVPPARAGLALLDHLLEQVFERRRRVAERL